MLDATELFENKKIGFIEKNTFALHRILTASLTGNRRIGLGKNYQLIVRIH